MKLSVVIPARDEAGSIAQTLESLHTALVSAGIHHELLIVDDGSTDGTADIVARLKSQIPEIVLCPHASPHGFGLAVRYGLELYTGEAVAIFMADGSDLPGDLVRFFQALREKGTDCVFGSRFIHGGFTKEYPFVKKILNRLGNNFIRLFFRLAYNDTTNAFKLYRRHVVDGLRPFLSHHYNLTVELPLKAIIRGYSFAVLPNGWINRRAGESKLRVKEMGSRYLFIVIYCLIEKWLSRGDYRRSQISGDNKTPNSESAPASVS